MTVICGVDVSSTHLDARDGPAARFANTLDGIAALAAFCTAHAVALVALEATGGYERQPFALLWADGVPCAILNPRSSLLLLQGFFQLCGIKYLPAEPIGGSA